MRTFDIERRVVIRKIAEDHIVRDDELIQMFEDPLFRFRLCVDKQVICHREYVRIRENSTLRSQEKRVAPRPGNQLLNMSRGHAVEKPGSILSHCADFPAAR